MNTDHTKVLDFMAREINGGILTGTSLTAFIAAENAANSLGINRTSLESAELAVLLPTVPLERIRKEFDLKTVNIVNDLRGSFPHSKIAVNAAKMHAMAGSDEICRDAAIAAMAAEAVLTIPDDYYCMEECLGEMIVLESDNERRIFLKNLRSQITERSATDEDGTNHNRFIVISVSIDVCGSTELKKCMKDCAQDDEELLDKWYGEFYQQFLLLEWRFYSLLFQQEGGDGLAWDWGKTFFVKGIGDEIWLLYQVSEDDRWKLESLFARLLFAASDVAQRLIGWNSATDEAELSMGKHLKTRNLPLKFYVDVLDNATEIGQQREDFMSNKVAELVNLKKCRNSEDFIKLCKRLQAGYLLTDGRRFVSATRADYIGWEVDRFFRATKFALPCVVTVGENLFNKTCHLKSNSDEDVGGTGLMKTTLEYTDQSGGIHYLNCFRYVKEEISSKQLKGVGEKYTVYWMLRDSNLFGLHNPDAGRKIMKQTFKVFTRKMVKAERTNNQRTTISSVSLKAIALKVFRHLSSMWRT